MTRTNAVEAALSGVFTLLCLVRAGAQAPPAPPAQAPSGSTAGAPLVLMTAEQPKRPFELPPVEPRVSCAENQLSITADNATMASVLQAITRCIGVKFEVPEEAATERVYAQQGTGPVREMLETLLSATQYDYVIEASPTEPTKIASVILMARAKDDSGPANPAGLMMTPARRAWLSSRQSARPADSAGEGVQPKPDEPGPAPETPAESTVAAVAPAASPSAATPSAGEVVAVASEKPAAGAAESAAKAPAASAVNNPGSDVATATDAAQAPPPSAVAAATATSGGPAADSGAPAAVTKETQDRIHGMQQLFEQRRQMISGQGAPQAAQ